MATAREYFDKDSSSNLRVDAPQKLADPNGKEFEVDVALAQDFEARAKFGLLYVPETTPAIPAIEFYISKPEAFADLDHGTEASLGMHGTDENISSKDLIFTNRITVYTPQKLSPEQRNALRAAGSRRNLQLVIRDGNYVDARSSCEKPLAFISHDSRDKDAFVRELAAVLQRMLIFVWYDEYSLIAGQSLRSSIEKGLRECRKCVLVVSPNFLGNGGWTKAEFDSVFTRELLEESNLIIPVWLNVTKQDVYNYSMRLVDKVGIPANVGVEEVARRVSAAVRAE
jgi:TIR domain